MRTRTGCRHCVPSSGMCLSTTSPSQEPRHHDLLPEQEVPHFARGVPAAAAAEQGLPLHHAAPVVLKWSVTQAGRPRSSWTPGCGTWTCGSLTCWRARRRTCTSSTWCTRRPWWRSCRPSRQLWSRGQQVIVSYEDESSLGRHCELWPGIPYWWGNTAKTEALIRYLGDHEELRPPRRVVTWPAPTSRRTCNASWRTV
uniref:Uncharacterized protein n=1 Tax=Macaca fascicularis TaxID=9541 RepID=A0A2K5UEQ3_MACFA